MKPAVFVITVVFVWIITGCRAYRLTPEKMIERQAKFIDTQSEDTLLDFSSDQPLRVAITASRRKSSCVYLGYAPRTRTKRVYLNATKRLFQDYNQASKRPQSTSFAALKQQGDSLELTSECVSHILIDDNIYRFNDFNYAVSEFRRVLKTEGKLMLRIIEFRKAVLDPKRQLAFKSKPEGTTTAIKEYFEQRGFKLVEMHKTVLSKPMARATKEKELVFLFSKV